MIINTWRVNDSFDFVTIFDVIDVKVFFPNHVLCHETYLIVEWFLIIDYAAMSLF